MSTQCASTPQAGERWRFVRQGMPPEEVDIRSGAYGRVGFATSAGEIFVLDDAGRPDVGTLEPIAPPKPPPEPPPPKQHDQISLKEWEHKIRHMRWP